MVCGLPVVGPWLDPAPKNEEIELTRPELWAVLGEANFLWLRLEKKDKTKLNFLSSNSNLILTY